MPDDVSYFLDAHVAEPGRIRTRASASISGTMNWAIPTAWKFGYDILGIKTYLGNVGISRNSGVGFKKPGDDNMIIKEVVRAYDISGASEGDVVNVLPETEVREVVRVLAKHKIGIIAVCDGQGALQGVLSERDIIRAIGEHNDAALAMKAEAVMTKDAQSCKPEDDPMNVIEAMCKGKFRHMPVVDDGKLVGIVSSKDIFCHLSSHLSPEEQARLWTRELYV